MQIYKLLIAASLFDMCSSVVLRIRTVHNNLKDLQ
jgi:hypothetical protein